MRAEPDQAARLLEVWADRPIEFDASRIGVPTLIVHGTEDTIAPIDYSRRLSQEIADVELVVLDGTGHVPTLTRPRIVAEAIDRRFPS
jgi:pimeloyl-ACP methyl ester carboxylesterase